MRISEAVERLIAIQRAEGDIEIELPDGTLMHQLDVVTRAIPQTTAPCSKRTSEKILASLSR